MTPLRFLSRQRSEIVNGGRASRCVGAVALNGGYQMPGRTGGLGQDLTLETRPSSGRSMEQQGSRAQPPDLLCSRFCCLSEVGDVHGFDEPRWQRAFTM
jgi:hypothetical protein